jgi:hypothetical protein
VKKSGEYTSNASYEDCRAWYLNYMSDTTNYDGYFLIFGDDGNGFVPISDMLEPLKFEEKRNNDFIDTLVWLYNATQLLDVMIYDCSTIDRYNGDFNPEPYADAIGGIEVSGIADVELCEAFLALSEALARDIRKGLRTDTIYYEEVRRLHEVMDNLFGNFVDSHYSESNYDCSKYVPDYETIHAKAIVDTAHYRDELLQMIFNEKNFEKQCIYAREFAYANWHNVNGEPVDVVAAIDILLSTTSYSPLLFDLWLIWRTALQGSVLSGISNDSSMYNIYYNAIRRRVAYRYLTRLNEKPNDKLAFDGLMKLIHKSSITRNSGCYFGNNSFLDQMEIYGQCKKR